MLGSIFMTAPLLLASVLAAPGWGNWGGQNWGAKGPAVPCLDDAEASAIIADYTYLLRFPQGANFTSIANARLSDKFFVSSDSINTLAGIPLGVNAYPSKQAFIGGQATTPAIPQLATLGYFYTCDQIAWRWNATAIGSGKYEVKGIITFDVNATTNQINAVYSEFNSAAWLSNIGNPECQKK